MSIKITGTWPVTGQASWARATWQEGATTAFSLSFWAKASSATGDGRRYWGIQKKYNAGGASPWNSYALTNNSGEDNLRGLLGTTADYWGVEAIGGNSGLASVAWHHICMVYDGTNLTTYIDNTQCAQTAASGRTITYYGTDPLLFLGTADPVSICFAEAAMWTSALSSGDRSSLAGGANPLAIGTPAWYIRAKTDTAEHYSSATATLTSAAIDADHPAVDDPPSGSAVLLLVGSGGLATLDDLRG